MTGHLEGLSNELDGLGDTTLQVPFNETQFFKTLDEIIDECDYPKVTKTIISLKNKLLLSKISDYWQIIRNFSDDMPCDCGECEGVQE